MNEPLRLVLDTNVALDCLVFDDPRAQRLVALMEAKLAVAITREDCLDELARVLAYPQFALDGAAQHKAFARFAAWTRSVVPADGEIAALPRCRDRDDQKFLEVARDGRAAWLVTKDKALLALARRISARVSFRIVHPSALALDAISASAG